MEVFVSTNFVADSGTYNTMFGTNAAITFASQLKKVEVIRSQDAFADRLRCLQVFGSKVKVAKALGNLVLTLT